MNKRLALLLLLLCGLVHADDSAEKERLKKQREAIEAEHAQREKVCHQQFVVNSCLEKARIDEESRGRDAAGRLDQRGVAAAAAAEAAEADHGWRRPTSSGRRAPRRALTSAGLRGAG